MRKNSISEFKLKKEGFEIELKRGANGGTATGYGGEDAPVVTYAQPMMIPAPGQALAVPAPVAPLINEVEIKSPMIGTFYRAPSPEAAPYVEVGMEVNPDTVVCIIEAMKVMNEIKAEAKGVITQVMVENAKPVEFGQPLFKVRPS